MVVHDVPLLYLNRREVETICQRIDSVEAIRSVFALHASGQTQLPDEAYMAWKNPLGESVRSLNMPAYIGGAFEMAGTKIINGNISNPTRGFPRASGLTVLYDPITVRPCCIMEGAYISSLRTASVSALAIDLLSAQQVEVISVIGSGVLAQAHIQLLVARTPSLKTIKLYDTDSERARALQETLGSFLTTHHVTLQSVSSAEEAIRETQIIIPATTTTVGYIRFSWLAPGAVLVNVSLDDALPEVVQQAHAVVVDDWQLVKNDQQRLLGKMYRVGEVCGPDETDVPPGSRKIDAQIGELVLGSKEVRRSEKDIILVNPFGLAIQDIVIASQVYSLAREMAIGTTLER
ncbi:ornithine cyclodeaminase [Dictyobacter alpinus]|uniref:Ornithine cyclodeaminase n=1 Tax=Dictyobacter alpinus TaxID=2014873 RepID=A0A402BB06_9CHLR|nr:ornithine cyclodeaminase family protein [Dictyobacter alpinus]GCE28524.1 ornithine cyclodeaminase [Dictyobacter alpinus]